VVIDDLDVESVTVCKTEAQPPLIVDANAPLAGPVAFQGFEAIGWRRTQVFDTFGEVQVLHAHQGAAPDIARQSAGLAGGEQPLGFLVGEAPYHRAAPVVLTNGNAIVNEMFTPCNRAVEGS
jgi:hypothetical protein